MPFGDGFVKFFDLLPSLRQFAACLFNFGIWHSRKRTPSPDKNLLPVETNSRIVALTPRAATGTEFGCHPDDRTYAIRNPTITRLVQKEINMLTRFRPLVVAVLLLTATILASTFQSREFRKTVDFQPGGQLTIKTDLGSVKLTSWDQNQVEIYARIEPQKDTDSEYAARAVESARIEVTGDARSLTIRSEFEDVPRENYGRRLPNIHYEIRAPRQLSLNLDADRCKVDAAGFAGKIKINTDRTTVSASDLTGEIEVRMDRGNARLTGLQGKLFVQTDRTESKFEFLRLEGDSQLNIDRGECELRVPDGQGLALKARNGRRETFQTDFAVATSTFDKERIEGTINGGGPQLIVNADRGTVRLKRR
jgi:hypothetical protein